MTADLARTLASAAKDAHFGIRSIQIASRSPCFDGTSFGHVGAYEKLEGCIYAEAAVPVIAGSRRTFINQPFAQPGRYSRLHIRSGTLVAPRSLDISAVPGLKYEGIINELHLMDYSVLPPREGDRKYPIFVVVVDSDGNPVDGLLHPLLCVPIGTHFGWNLRAPAHGEGELYSIVGALYPFAQTGAERKQNSDRRPSLTERYGSHDGWVQRLETACAQLGRKRHLLQEDADTLIRVARTSWNVFEVI